MKTGQVQKEISVPLDLRKLKDCKKYLEIVALPDGNGINGFKREDGTFVDFKSLPDSEVINVANQLYRELKEKQIETNVK